MMRLFIAVRFGEEVTERILAVQERIREQARRGAFSPPENLHLTLVFLGETPGERIGEIEEAMKMVNDTPAFELVFSKTGFFKRAAKELWWLGTGENAAGLGQIREIRGRLAAALRERGFSIDTRPFNAHITLGREIPCGGWPFQTESISVPVKRISLMLSERLALPERRPGPRASFRNALVYTELFGQDLGNGVCPL